MDLMAIRKDHHCAEMPRGGLFEIILIRVKGGSARRPSDADIRRLQTRGRSIPRPSGRAGRWGMADPPPAAAHARAITGGLCARPSASRCTARYHAPTNS